jgi:hypothetical protein
VARFAPTAMRLALRAAALASNLFAQTSGGVFRGEIRDPAMARVPGVRIQFASGDTGVVTTAQFNAEGLFVSPTLVPGTYLLTAAKRGFKTETFGPVVLPVNQTVRVDFSLVLGEVTESVHVEASPAQLLATDSPEIGQVIVAKQVSEIPLNGRMWQQLIALSAGVNAGSPGETGSPHAVNVNGQRTKANLFLIDGISTTSSAQGRGNNFNVPLEAVREFSVQAGAYSAEFGNVAGGVINLQSKYGTNHWHGSLFEFFRNDALDAANYFSNATSQPKNPLRFNQFGGSLGGPLRRERTFIFGDYQGTLTRNAMPMIATVRPSEQRTGDFSSLRNGSGMFVPIYDPSGPDPARTPFPDNLIPAVRLDPAAVRIGALLPPPNQFDSAGGILPFNNFAVTRSISSGAHSFDIRLDHQFNQTSTIFVRHSFQDSHSVTPSLFGFPLGGPPTLAGKTEARTQNTGIGHVYQFTPLLINEFRLGLNRQASSLMQEDYGHNLSEEFGIPGVNRSPATSGLSTLVVSGLFSVGGSILTPLRVAATNWNASEKLTWIKGRHNTRVGFDGQYEMGSTGYLVFGRGYYTFLNLTTSTAQGPSGGDAFASFLLGAPFQILRDDFPAGMVTLISPRYGFYAQDDVRLTPKLTINAGARYDIMPYPREKYGRLSNFDPGSRTMLLAGRNTNPRLRRTDYADWAPRVGLAYSPSRSSAIRAGYGIGFIDPLGSASVLNSTEFNIPFYFRDNITQFPFAAPRYTLSGSLPSLAVPSPSLPAGDQRYLVPTDRNQYSQTWSLSLQKTFSTFLIVETAYVGTSGSRLLITTNINAAPPGPANPAPRRPYGPALGEIRAISNSGHSTYHGLQSRIEQRFARGIYFLASYTWSKAIDNQSTGTDDAAASGQSPQNPRNLVMDRGLSSFDRPHRFVASAVWDVPFARGERGTLRSVLGRWQLSGILEAQAGAPFSVAMPCAAINAEGNNCRPNRLASGELPPDLRSVNQWFDKTAFLTPSPAAYGTAGRNILRGPGSANIDLSVAKSFAWGHLDARRIQLRCELFNLFNHTNLGLPVHSTDSPAIGTITGALPARVIQLGARLEF